MTDFDPWSSSFDEALRASANWDAVDPLNPIFQWSDAQEVLKRRTAVEAGDGFKILGCVRMCAARGLVMPDWLALAFITRYDAVLNCRALSWDDPRAFGAPYPKHTRLNSLRKKRELRFAVLNAVTDIKRRDPDRAIGPELFEQVGRPFGLGKTLAEEYYYEAKKFCSVVVD